MTLLIFLIVLSILIFIHELGHFLVAKKVGIKVEEFAIGFPPKIWKKKVGETTYLLNAIPIGGYVKLYGEDDAVDSEKERAFYHKGKKERALVSIAGVVMNFLLGVAAFSLIYAVQGIPKETGQVKVLETALGSPARLSGIQEGDVVTRVDEQDVAATREFQKIVAQKKGNKITLQILREGKKLEVQVTPRTDAPKGQGPLGVIVSSQMLAKPSFWQLPAVSLWYGAGEALSWLKNIFVGLGSIFPQLARGVVPQDVAGPVGIFQITSSFAKVGVLALFWFVGVLSINLSVLNAMPFPALDGGRLLFIGVEAVFGRRVLPKVEKVVHTVGLIILLFLILLVTLHDINRLFNGGFSSLQ